MTDFHIDSEAGRIGQLWWFNSNNVERPTVMIGWPPSYAVTVEVWL